MRVKPISVEEAQKLKEVAPQLKECEPFIKTKTQDNLASINYPVKELPSKGKAYPPDAIISYKPLNYGDVKYLATSSLSEEELYSFYLEKINTSFNKMELTFYDFQFILTLIRLSVFGDEQLTLEWKCPKCGNKNSNRLFLSQIEFYDIDFEVPIKVLRKNSDEVIEFWPFTIGDWFKLRKFGKKDDKNAEIALTIRNYPFDEAYKIVTEEFVGPDINILEMIETMYFHGPKPVKYMCSKEGCGYVATLPFYELPNYATTSSEYKETLRARVLIDI